MCGIAGFISKKTLFSKEQLVEITDLIAHRGPDADGFFYEGTIGLGHRRLSILDLSDAANQPMESACGNYIIVYNGEVYNYREIIPKLNVKLKTTSDTEVILEAFIQFGPDCVNMFNGMFAIAIYDKSKKELFICRDRMGIKPIFYFHDGETFAFASELKSLLKLLPEMRTLNFRALSQFLNLNYIPAPYTIFEEFKKFPSGHYALICNGKIDFKSYWNLDDKVGTNVLSDETKAKEELHNLLKSSVSYRMISDVPFGTFLSGGIDSSLVTAIAQSQSEVPLNTFSIAFESSKYNESNYARQVAKHLNTHHHELILKESDAIALFDRYLTAYDEPFADASGISTMLVSKFAREHVTMTLSGDGGDELFMGYGFYKWRKRLDNPIVQLLRPALKFGLSLGNDRMERVSRLFENVKKENIASHIFAQESLNYSENELNKYLLNKEQVELLKEQHGLLKRKLSSEESQALFDLKYYIQDDLLAKVDRASMQFSLETRVPLIDYRIVEFALNLHQNLKIRNGSTKYLLKQILYDYLPREIFDRPKWGFGIPLNKWLRNDLFYLQEKYLNREITERFGIFDFDKIEPIIKSYNGGKDYFIGRVWLVIVLHAFLERNQ